MTLKAEMIESPVVPLAPAGTAAGGQVKDTVTISGVHHVVYVVRWGLFDCSAWQVEQLSDVTAGVQHTRLTGDALIGLVLRNAPCLTTHRVSAGDARSTESC